MRKTGACLDSQYIPALLGGVEDARVGGLALGVRDPGALAGRVCGSFIPSFESGGLVSWRWGGDSWMFSLDVGTFVRCLV